MDTRTPSSGLPLETGSRLPEQGTPTRHLACRASPLLPHLAWPGAAGERPQSPPAPDPNPTVPRPFKPPGMKQLLFLLKVCSAPLGPSPQIDSPHCGERQQTQSGRGYKLRTRGRRVGRFCVARGLVPPAAGSRPTSATSAGIGRRTVATKCRQTMAQLILLRSCLNLALSYPASPL